jgi:transcriptional regulator with XRE-family HTH domain
MEDEVGEFGPLLRRLRAAVGLSQEELAERAPVTPYVAEGEETIDVSTGLAYPLKAERARRDPPVALLFADVVGSGVDDAPVVLIQGHAAVRDADLQAGTDRYVARSTARNPAAVAGLPDFLIRSMGWYFARIWVEVTPQRILWWPGGELDAQPEVWTDSTGAALPVSDPRPRPIGDAAPGGGQRNRTRSASADRNAWRAVAAEVLPALRHCDLTTIDAEGRPVILPVSTVHLDGDAVGLTLSRGVAALAESGPACLTLHDHDEVFSWQRNVAFVGTYDADTGRMVVERCLDSLNVPKGKMQLARELLSWRRRFRPVLDAEAARRGQTAPVVRPELVTRSR